ncbi:MAG TPA: AbrB/MazE/SpoVT family DNA-binding domain-containing protein [Candidatus Dormibacteraeota bacterium]|nr:AbrB/MazE/SpoVT family DNA-binding domain-containing protein [Candidatus Dormibacteraeota bacterium]
MASKVKRVRRTTRVSTKNQVTLPVAALTAARVAKGDEMRVTAKGDGRILLERATDPLDEFVGSLPGLAGATQLEALRNEWDR